MLGEVLLGVFMCVCIYMYEVGIVRVCFKKKSEAICMGLMHSTPQCQQQQYNTVVKAMSQPFV